MSYQIHGHAVIDLILASRRSFNRGSLITYIEQHFGVNTRYCTCSAINLTAGELVDLLAERGKFHGPADAFTVKAERVCRH